MHFEAGFAGAVAVQAQPDVVHLDGGAVMRGGGERDLEFARQEREFRMQGGYWRSSSAQMRGSSISSGATPAHWSVVILRTQLPLVCMPCRPTLARSAMAVGSSSSLIQWNWIFCRVVKWPKLRS